MGQQKKEYIKEGIDNNWKQETATHCPSLKCKGMLLQSDFCHEERCSDCGKYWIGRNKYVETEAPKQEIEKK